jgi:hypothetical protein
VAFSLRKSRSARQRERGKQPCKFFHESNLQASYEHFRNLEAACGWGAVRNRTVTQTASLSGSAGGGPQGGCYHDFLDNLPAWIPSR